MCRKSAGPILLLAPNRPASRTMPHCALIADLDYFAGCDIAHQRRVCFQKIVVADLAGRNPNEVGEDAVIELAAILFHQKKPQLDGGAAAVAMRDGCRFAPDA